MRNCSTGRKNTQQNTLTNETWIIGKLNCFQDKLASNVNILIRTLNFPARNSNLERY